MTASAHLNRTIFIRDNLDVMRGVNSDIIDLIYLDPPFNSNRNYAAPVGSKAAGAFFKDIWTLDDVKEEWVEEIEATSPSIHHFINASEFTHGKPMKAYLMMMAIRLIEMHRILKPTGSIYLHCDPTASHYLKTLMDAVFGPEQFRNEIVWAYSGGGTPLKYYPRKHDIILFYTKSDSWHFEREYKPYKENTQSVGKHSTLSGGGSIDLERGTPITDWWTDIKTVTGWSPEKTGYPTQKPLALLERIIKCSSNDGDIIMDPFCGCATALVAAEKLNRRWLGIDISQGAYNMVLRRMVQHGIGNGDTPTLNKQDIVHRTDIPIRTDLGIRPSKNIKRTLYGNQAGLCNGCGQHFMLRNLTIDHIVPRAIGGAHADENLQLLCQACNSLKGTGTQENLKVNLRRQGIL